MLRLIYAADITERRPGALGWASAYDLTLGACAIEEGARLPLVHCADFERERLLYTLHEENDVAAVLDAPFYYAAQLDHARSVLSVPFERIGEIDGPASAFRPCFVFSIGRTGSTLLSRLFTAVGRQSASEPDIFTQVCNLDEDQQSLLPPGTGAAPCRCRRRIAGAGAWAGTVHQAAQPVQPQSGGTDGAAGRCTGRGDAAAAHELGLVASPGFC